MSTDSPHAAARILLNSHNTMGSSPSAPSGRTSQHFKVVGPVLDRTQLYRGALAMLISPEHLSTPLRWGHNGVEQGRRVTEHAHIYTECAAHRALTRDRPG